MTYRWCVIITAVILSGCYKDIQPIPNNARISPSISIPIGTTDFSVGKSFSTIGLPEINLNEPVPDWARYRYIEFSETILLDLSSVYDRASAIRYLAFRVNVWNQLPVEGGFQGYFYDGGGVILDSLIHKPPLVIPQGTISISGKVISEGYLKTDIPFSQERILLLRNAKRLIITARVKLDLAKPSDFQFFETLKVRTQLGVRVDFDLDTNGSVGVKGS